MAANFRQQLATMGKTITDEEYALILMALLLDSYDGILNSISCTANITWSDIPAMTVIRLAQDEYSQHIVKKGAASTKELFTAGTQKQKQKNTK
jgi:hypothetical protein